MSAFKDTEINPDLVPNLTWIYRLAFGLIRKAILNCARLTPHLVIYGADGDIYLIYLNYSSRHQFRLAGFGVALHNF